MFRRLVRVVLTASVDSFTRGMRTAGSSFARFISGIPQGIAIGSLALQGLQAAIGMVGSAFQTVQNLARNFFDTFLEGAIAAERFDMVLNQIVGDEQRADQIQRDLAERVATYGLNVREAELATTQMALALRGMMGEVDPAKLDRLQDVIQSIITVRPDILGGIQAVGRGVSAALAGDFTTLTRLLDIPLSKIQGLSAETQALLFAGDAAVSQQLGVVTRLGENATASGEDMISALEELLAAAGITSEAVDEMAASGLLSIDQLLARFQEMADRVGGNLLPIVLEAFGDLVSFIDSHQKTINAFLDAFSSFTAAGFKALIRLIGGTDGKNAVEVLQAMTGWLQQTADALEKIRNFGDIKLFPNMNPQVADFLNAIASPDNAQRASPAGLAAVEALQRPFAGEGSGGITLPGAGGAQRVIVSVEPSELFNLKIRQTAEGAANAAVGGLTSTIRREGDQK